MVTGVVHTIKMALRGGEGGLFYSRINAACADALPPTDRPGLLSRKTPFTSLPLHFFSCAILHRVSRPHPHPSMPLPFLVIGRHEFPGLTPGRGLLCDRAGIDGWHENGFGIVRGHVDDRSKDFRGFRGSWRDTQGLRSFVGLDA